MFLNCLPEAFHATRTILKQSSAALTMKHLSSALLAEDERIKTRENNDGFAGSIIKTNPAKCHHVRKRAFCWTCDPNLHPSKLKCQDCFQMGHRSKSSTRCSKHMPQTSGTAGFSADAEIWSPAKPFAGMTRQGSPKGVQKRTKSGNKTDLRFVIDSGCSQALLKN